MRTYLIAFLLSMVCSLIATPLVRRLAVRVGAMDIPGERRIHLQPIPRMGGLAIAAAFSVPLLGLALYVNKISVAFYQNRLMVLGLLVGGILMLAVGIFDDIRGARPILKLLSQCLVALMCYKLGYQITILSNPLTGGVFVLDWLSLPITILWVVGLINAINLIDGVDGLASGVAFFACVTMFVICVSTGDIVNALIVCALGGAIIGFLFFNFNPATIFLGDTGSLFLGFVLAVISISGSKKGYTALSILAPAMALGVPILDTSLAILRRMLTGKPLMSADRHHIHHRLLRRGLSQRQVVLAIYGLCALLASVSLATIYLKNRWILAVILIALGGFLLFSLRYLGYIEHIKDERRLLFLDGVFALIGDRTGKLIQIRHVLARATSLATLWAGLEDFAREMGITGMTLKLRDHPLGPQSSVVAATPRFLHFQVPDHPHHRDLGRIQVVLGAPDRPLGDFTMEWNEDNGHAHRALYQLYLEVLRPDLEMSLQRLVGDYESALSLSASKVLLPDPVGAVH